MLIAPTLINLPPSEYVEGLKKWLQVAIAMQCIVAVGRLICFNVLGAIQFAVLAIFGSIVIRRRFDINFLIPYLVVSFMTFLLDMLLLVSAFSAAEKADLEQRFDVDIAAASKFGKVHTIWDLLHYPFPFNMFPIILVLSPISTGLSTVISYMMYSDMQHQLDLFLPEEEFINEPIGDQAPRDPLRATGPNAGGSSRQTHFQAFQGQSHQL